MTRSGFLCAFLLALLAFAPPTAAQALVDAFSVRGVEVDVTAANIQAAKDQAIADGQRQAFRILLERLTQPADHSRLPKADGVEYVRDFSVDQERSTPVRYLATLTVRFNPAAVRKLLRDANIAYAEPRSRAVIVVPVLKPAGGTPVLWEDPNPWRAAWTQQGSGLVPLVVPGADSPEAQAINADQAAAGESARIQALSEAFKGADVMVVAATLAPGGRNVDVLLYGSGNLPKPFDTVAYAAQDAETTDAMLARAARDIQRAIDTVYKQPNLLQFDRAGTISALVPLEGVEDWLTVRDLLGRVPQVRKWELVSLSRAEAALLLHVVGDPEQVKAALARQGLRLEAGESFWTIRAPARR
jgi:hypothetical protein